MFGQSLSLIMGALGLSQLPSESCMDCQISRLANSRDLLKVSQLICCKLYIHFSFLADQMSQVGSPVIAPAAPPGHLTFLHNVSTAPSLRKHRSSKVSMPWSSTIALGVHDSTQGLQKLLSYLPASFLFFLFFTWGFLLLLKRCIIQCLKRFMYLLGFPCLTKILV